MEDLTQEQMQEVWDQEAAKLDVGDTPASELLAAAPEDSPQETEPQPEVLAQEQDPFAGLPDIVRARLNELDELRASQAQLLHHVKTAEGRVSAMQREFQQARQAATQVEVQAAPSQGQMAAAAKNPEKWEQLKGDFPEWAGAMEEYVTSKLGNLPMPQNMIQPQQVMDYVQQQMSAMEGKTVRRIEEARIEGKYENWRDLVNTSDFAGWYSIQAPEVRSLADSASARDALRMLDLFHASKTRSATDIKQERNARLSAAATTRPGQTPPPKTLDDMSATELWNYEAAKREKTRAQRGY